MSYIISRTVNDYCYFLLLYKVLIRNRRLWIRALSLQYLCCLLCCKPMYMSSLGGIGSSHFEISIATIAAFSYHYVDDLGELLSSGRWDAQCLFLSHTIKAAYYPPQSFTSFSSSFERINQNNRSKGLKNHHLRVSTHGLPYHSCHTWDEPRFHLHPYWRLHHPFGQENYFSLYKQGVSQQMFTHTLNSQLLRLIL